MVALGWHAVPHVSLSPRLAAAPAAMATGATPPQLLPRAKSPRQQVRAAAPRMDGEQPEAFVGSTFGSTSAMFYRQGTLVLEDGTRLRGVSFGYEAEIKGELVFTTGMVGYPESLTDPSYRGQMLVMTYPIVGNYGVPNDEIDEHGLSKFFESDKVQVAALIVSDYSHHHSHWNSQRSLSQWLTQQKVPALYGLDTRLLTKKIREKGALRARIEFDDAVSFARPDAEGFEDVNTRNLVAEVSLTEPRIYGAGNTYKVLALDCGIKVNIIRSLVQRGCEVTLLPWDAPLLPHLEKADGIFLSNGPGDPAMVQETIGNIRDVLTGMADGSLPVKPIFGICLGNQLLGLAAGASTYKLPFGNRGQNQPVLNLLNKKCVITPQNHGFALDASKLPDGWRPLFTNANDDSNEGIMHTTLPWFTAQFHPEAKCGPSDTSYLFDEFVGAMADPSTSISTRLGAGAYTPPPEQPLTKVLLLGSGGLSIGQAGEFDYSGAQAIKALKEEGTHRPPPFDPPGMAAPATCRC
jgi:carbamoyl-phosphate synthase (ammonia)